MNKSITKMTGKSLSEVDKVLKNDYVCWGLRILLVLYAAMVAPNLNEDVSSLFDNVFVRLIIAAVIVFLSFHDPTLAILLSICFVVSIQTLNKHKVSEISQLPNENFDGGYQEMIEDVTSKFSSGVKNVANVYKNLPEESRQALNTGIINQVENKMGEKQDSEENFKVEMQNQEAEVPQRRMYNEISNHIASPTDGVCGGPPFTSKEQFFDAQNNYVSRNQRNQVATFCPQTGPQGTGSLPIGYSGLSDSASF